MACLFAWSGVDHQGQVIRGRSYADSKTSLKYKLHQQQIITRKIELQNPYFLKFRRWLRSKQTLFFLTQLHALLNIGLNLRKAISILQRNQTNSELSELLACLKYQLSYGKQLSTVLKLYPLLFDNITLQFIKNGETTGQVDQALEQALIYYDQKQKTLNQILTTLLYPTLLFIVCAGVLMILIMFVIPQFESIYSQSQAKLPFITVLILNTSGWLGANIGGLVISFTLIIAVIIFLQKFKPLPWTDYIPVLNKTLKKINSLRFCQTVSGLYAAGLNITECVEACNNLSADYHYQSAIEQTLVEIKKGNSFANALAYSNYFDSLIIQFIKTGEESASLALMLNQCSKYYHVQLDNYFERLKIILEPILIISLGAIIGIILVAMYLPVFNLGSSF